MQIDHVLLATDDLEAGDRLLASAHGLTTTGGGRHDGIGTHNRIVPLGNGYLELIAVHDPEEAASSPLGSVLAAAIAERAGRFLGWCVRGPRRRGRRRAAGHRHQPHRARRA